MNVGAPESALVERFLQDLRTLDSDPSPLALAVSGGPDSLALLLLAHSALPGAIAAATVDHGLRPESAEEAALVADVCRRLGVPHEVLQAEVDRTAASLQQSARRARYAALGRWMSDRGFTRLATAHHADDQAETLMMRLVRGAGVAGLAGVRSTGPLPGASMEGRLLRPLLRWRRAELRAIVDAAGIVPAEDSSNHDPRFDRVRMRAQLQAAAWLDPVRIGRSAAALADADEALGWAALEAIKTVVRQDGSKLLFTHGGLPRELKRRIVHDILDRLGQSGSLRGVEMDRLLYQLEQGGTSTLAQVKCVGGTQWTFERAPARRSGT